MKLCMLRVSLASVVVLTSILFYQRMAQAEIVIPEQLVIVLKPGETARVSVVINPYAAANEIHTVQLYGIAQPFEGEPTYGRCWAQVKATGGFGQTLWTWSTEEFYAYDDETVRQDRDPVTDYTLNYAWWEFVKDDYFMNYWGNGNLYVSQSIGYFYYPPLDERKRGNLEFKIFRDGSCSASGSISGW